MQLTGDSSKLRQQLWRCQAAIARLLHRLSRPRPMVQGSFYLQKRRCGNPNCRCARGDLHEAWVITRKAGGKGWTYMVPAEERARLRQLTLEYRQYIRGRAVLRQASGADCSRWWINWPNSGWRFGLQQESDRPAISGLRVVGKKCWTIEGVFGEMPLCKASDAFRGAGWMRAIFSNSSNGSDQRSGWSRKRLAKGLCEQWQWRDARGRLKDFAARSLLLKLEGQGRIPLPPLQESQRRAPRRVDPLAQWEPPSLIEARELSEIKPLQANVVQASAPEWKRWAFYLDRFHYCGYEGGRGLCAVADYAQLS